MANNPQKKLRTPGEEEKDQLRRKEIDHDEAYEERNHRQRDDPYQDFTTKATLELGPVRRSARRSREPTRLQQSPLRERLPVPKLVRRRRRTSKRQFQQRQQLKLVRQKTTGDQEHKTYYSITTKTQKKRNKPGSKQPSGRGDSVGWRGGSGRGRRGGVGVSA